jgi:transcriptional regulator with XRE-family HTH domain
MDSIENLGKKLKELRETRELTMDMVVFDVAQQYHVEFTKGNLSRWENGINYPSLIYAACLAKYYGVSVDYLIGNTDTKTPVNLLVRKRGDKDGKS